MTARLAERPIAPQVISSSRYAEVPADSTAAVWPIVTVVRILPAVIDVVFVQDDVVPPNTLGKFVSVILPDKRIRTEYIIG